MIQWMPAFAQALARPDRHPFYNAVAAFIQSTLEHTRRSW